MEDLFDEKLDDLRYEYRKLKKQCEDLKNTLDSWNKDEEIQEAKKSAEYAYEHSLLTLSDNELKSLRTFRERHYKECAKPYRDKAKGNTYIYTLTGTGLGTIIEITCPICGATLDVTDINNW